MFAPIRTGLAVIFAFHAIPVISSLAADAHETRVMCSGGFSAALQRLAPVFEKNGSHLVVIRGPSMGTTNDAIPARLARGEKCDVLIMVGSALDALHARGLTGETKILADSRIGLVVKAGTVHPDISSDAALRKTLLAAPLVAFSDSASGVYVSHTLFDRLGIARQMASKARQIQETPVAEIVARGDAALGLQQISEIIPVAGASLVGPIPEDLQKITHFSAALCRDSPNPEGGKALIHYLSSAQNADDIRSTGLDPVQTRAWGPIHD